VLVDQDMRIVQFLGRTGRYLEPKPGDVNMDLYAMARDGLSVDLHSAMIEARQGDTPAVRPGVRIEGEEGIQLVDIEVSVLDRTDAHAYLVIFSQPRQAPDLPWPLEGDEGSAERRELSYLTRELETTRRVMQALVDEKDLANEELKASVEASQSTNEELQSIGEELETAKEELQSTNEELTTVNEELQSRNEDLGVLNDDLRNLLYSLQIPMVMIDKDMRIRRYTVGDGAVLKLVQADLGRSIYDVSLRIQNSDVRAWITRVMQTGQVMVRDVRDADGRWLSMVIRPYGKAGIEVAEGSVSEGAVILFLEIDAAKRGQLLLEESARLGEALAEIDAVIHAPNLADGVLERVLPLVAVAMCADEAAGLVRVEGGWELRSVWGQGIPLDSIGTVVTSDKVPVAELAAASLAPAISRADDRLQARLDSADRFVLGSAIVVPVAARRKAVGVLYLSYTDPRVQFTEAQHDFIRKVVVSLRLASEAALSTELLAEAVEQRTAKLDRAVLALEQAVSTKNRFLADVSHELRTPLNSIIGFSTILASDGAGELPEEARKQAGFIRESGRELLSVVNTLLDSASIEAGVVKPKIEPFRLDDLLSSIESTMGPPVRKAGLEFAINGPSAPVTVVSDCGRIREILFNLIGNAMKFTSEGSVTLDVSADQRKVSFAVTDTGVGIHPDDLAKVMEPFSQLAQPGLAKSQGVGLGLAISSQIAALLGGHMAVASELGGGSTFTLVLPLNTGDGPHWARRVTDLEE
jgi:two-component system CheB/CheR fusion protein